MSVHIIKFRNMILFSISLRTHKPRASIRIISIMCLYRLPTTCVLPERQEIYIKQNKYIMLGNVSRLELSLLFLEDTNVLLITSRNCLTLTSVRWISFVDYFASGVDREHILYLNHPTYRITFRPLVFYFNVYMK